MAVLEDEDDPALSKLKQMSMDICIAYAGKATRSSQKIHNLKAGLCKIGKHVDYVVCMDDDVEPHQEFLVNLVLDLEGMPDVRVATAYPFDLPTRKDASMYSYATMAYHLPLSVGLAISTKTRFVWGGCMAFRGEDIQNDTLGILAAWTDGGYSDDLTVASRVNKLQLDVYCPAYAIFPQWLDSDIDLYHYWNYLRRQLFVLDTYADSHNKRTNYGLACLLLYGCIGYIWPTIVVLLGMSIYILQTALPLFSDAQKQVSVSPSFIYINLLFLLSTVYMVFGMRKMVVKTTYLLGLLHPELKYNEMMQNISWRRMLFGFWMANAISPFCLFYTFIYNHISWAGVRYKKHAGKVTVVQHGPCPCT